MTEFTAEYDCATVTALHEAVASELGPRRVMLVRDTVKDVVSAIMRKHNAVAENRSLYADRLAHYNNVLDVIRAMRESGEPEHVVVAAAMLAHGDSRTEDLSCVCAIETRPGHFYVFGYR